MKQWRMIHGQDPNGEPVASLTTDDNGVVTEADADWLQEAVLFKQNVEQVAARNSNYAIVPVGQEEA